MDQRMLRHLADYYDYYSYLVLGEQTIDEVKRHMIMDLERPESTVRGQMKKVEENPGLLIISPSGTMSVDRTGLADLLSEIRDEISRYCILEEVPEPDEVNEIRSVTESEYGMLKEKYMQTSEELVSLKESYAQALAELKNLKKRYVGNALAEKVLLMDSVNLDEDSVKDEWTFLSDLDYQIDVDKAMAEERKRKSFFREISDESREEAEECMVSSSKESADKKELNEKNYFRRIFKHVLTDKLLQGRCREIQEAKDAAEAAGYSFDRCSKLEAAQKRRSEFDRTMEQITRNRFGTINQLLKEKNLSNQEKLGLYAFFSRYHHTDMEAILNFAGEYCLNANWIIMLLEEPGVCGTYESVKGMLQQFIKASEVRMKLDLAKELIAGDWYVTADYGGQIRKFQMVPIEELQEIQEWIREDRKEKEARGEGGLAHAIRVEGGPIHTIKRGEELEGQKAGESKDREADSALEKAVPSAPAHPDFVTMFVGGMEDYEEV